MNNGQYLLPGEFAVVVAVLFAPPLLLAFIGQTVVYVRSSMFKTARIGRVLMSYPATALGSILLGGTIDQLAPQALNPILRVRDVPIGGGTWPIMPLAFASVAITAFFVSKRILSFEKRS